MALACCRALRSTHTLSAGAEAAAREQDEKDDWSRISALNLNGAATSLCYFDAKGMRFHLPAYLIADLHGQLTQDIRFHLNIRGLDARFSLLTLAQRKAVRAFLKLQLELLQKPNQLIESAAIHASIDGYWAEGVQTKVRFTRRGDE
jgi:hypothetical protein